ncbi:agmatinase [Limibaculum sp. M0105]|uniref:Agmatinase n=1 Tax=Thermohalobaculum xanthum TaxID=2753746 RepID=A0A8J7M5H7_9RHOB|nr:agmatinase [Thermohalobaculum xanthum]MBK0398633.1 agmatinase [Thermohalobaculum xanthum]
MTDPFRKDYAFLAEDAKAVTHDEPFYSGALSFCRRRYARDLAGVDLAVMGVPFDTSVTGRSGCRFGPRAVRAASTNIAWSRAWPSAVDPFEQLAVVDWGDIWWDAGYPAEVPGRIEAAISHVIGQGPAALLIGGDHFTTYPSLRAHAAKHGAPLSLIHFDAHSDTWGSDESGRIDHGTMFRRAVEDGILDPATSIQVGLRTTNDEPMGFEIRDANWVLRRSPEEVAAEIRKVVGDRPCYLTFDIDYLDPAFAPGTGTPVCGGPSTWHAKETLRALGGIDLKGMDMVEVSPAYDHAEITALAGATLALEMICLYARTRG